MVSKVTPQGFARSRHDESERQSVRNMRREAAEKEKENSVLKVNCS